MNEGKFEGFAIVEVMGRRSHGGYVSEVRIAGQEMLRVDVPNVHEEGKILETHFYPGASIYCLTPTSEQEVRNHEAAKQWRPMATTHQLTSGERPTDDDDGDHRDEEDDDLADELAADQTEPEEEGFMGSGGPR